MLPYQVAESPTAIMNLDVMHRGLEDLSVSVYTQRGLSWVCSWRACHQESVLLSLGLSHGRLKPAHAASEGISPWPWGRGRV
jgi:hypothetical protein